MKFREIETKYNADNISLSAFSAFCKSRNPEKFITAAGFDRFFHKVDDPDSFCRHRIGPDMNQLTFKRKTEVKNNFVRTEHNINLASDMTEDRVEAYVAEFGYQYNMSLYKTCFIYCYDSYILVYYIVYDEDMKELGRFMEIEMSEDYPWQNEEEAWGNLQIIEKLCKPLGLIPQARVKRSLFELYKKEATSC